MGGWIAFIGLILIILVLYLKGKLDATRKSLDSEVTILEEAETKYAQKIEELTHSMEQLHETAYTDATTGIGNKDYFLKYAPQKLKISQKFVMIGFGIANIVTINRLYGSAEGDRVLAFAAGLMKEITGSKDICAHVQSNLFVALLPVITRQYRQTGEMEENPTDPSEAFVRTMTERIKEYSDIYQVELKFGIFHIQNKDMPLVDMLNCVVLAQRSVPKDKTQNYAEFDEELGKKFEENRKMCAEMEQALEERKFVMYLQPMVDLHIHQIYSAEALVRWEHPERGLLSPYAFLPVFENTNLMLKLDYYMWEEACKTVRRWIDNKIEPIPVMVNISPIHLNSDAFIGVISRLLEHYKLAKSQLVLELPERALTSGGADVAAHIQMLYDSGFVLSIDNFGSMHSPVNLLRDLPVSMVKLDREFLTQNSKSEEGLTILRYLIAMAKELDLTVVTEGVETVQQANFLTEIGCDIAQGYFFSKPVNLRDFDSLNKKVLRQGFHMGEYYPTFADMENGIDIMENMLRN